MENNELDKILKEKLKGKMKIPSEMEGKIRQKVEEEKKNQFKTINIGNNNGKNNKYKFLKPLISVAAAVVIVFAVGTNLNKLPINNIINNTEVSTVAITSIEPTKSANGVLANDSEFTIHTDGQNYDKEDVKKILYVEPALEYEVSKVSNNEYKLKFKQNIPDNTIVKLQYVKDKITEDSWAYQTSNKLTISEVYPDDEEIASRNTTIEIKFSYASVENLSKYVTITPKVEGKWKHLGKVWRFTPSKQLKNNQKYTVSVKSGIKIPEGEELDGDYIFSFKVQDEGTDVEIYSHKTITADDIDTYRPAEQVKIYYEADSYNGNKPDIVKVQISKFKTVDDFIEYLKTKDYSKAEGKESYNFTHKQGYIQLSKTLPTGYYVASIINANGSELFNSPIQINSLSAFATATERDVIVWAAEGESLAKNVKVQYQGKEEKTNSQGIAKFEDIADGSKTVKYLTIGNNEAKLVVGIYNYDLENYPASYVYTDRPLYKNTDTIHIWGFVPKMLFFDKIEDEFYIELGNEGKQKVALDENGIIKHKIDLTNHADSENEAVKLYYKDTQIAARYVTIENYELQNYTYEVIKDKNYVYSGDKYEFDVKVNHITGLAVPNKSVVVECDEKTYRKTTNENGIAHFSIKITSDSEFIPSGKTIDIYNGDLEEYTDASTYFDIYVINRKTYIKIEENKTKEFNLELYKLALDRNVDAEYELKELYDGNYNTDVTVKLKEVVNERYITDYEYNEYTKENEPQYSYEETDTNIEDVKTISTQNGKITFDANTISLKKDTEEKHYNYSILFVYKDIDGKEITEEQYISNSSDGEYDREELGYSFFGWESDSYDGLYNIPTNIDVNYYYTYRYLLKKDKVTFKIGDTINLSLAESTESGIKDITNQGKVLRIVAKQDITKTDIIENNDFNYTFTEKDFPGCDITSAYFYQGKFYRMPRYYFDFESDERKVDIEIKADKEQYKPGDKVTLKVKTTNNGKPIKTPVNLSVVNEAVFEIQDDETDIAGSIYSNQTYPLYTYTSNNDYINGSVGGGGGGRRRAKIKLWRYRIFWSGRNKF